VIKVRLANSPPEHIISTDKFQTITTGAWYVKNKPTHAAVEFCQCSESDQIAARPVGATDDILASISAIRQYCSVVFLLLYWPGHAPDGGEIDKHALALRRQPFDAAGLPGDLASADAAA
jgi:hypothetical protein